MRRVVLPASDDRHVPIYIWGRAVPDGALDQLRQVASQPYVVAHVAAMPDLHVANGIAVGTVFATDDTIVPVALGADLGCGMTAVRFDYPAAGLSTSDLDRLLTRMSRLITVGDAIHRGNALHWSAGTRPRSARPETSRNAWWWQPLHRVRPRWWRRPLAARALGVSRNGGCDCRTPPASSAGWRLRQHPWTSMRIRSRQGVPVRHPLGISVRPCE